MKKKTTMAVLAVGLIAVFCAGSLWAHHSGSMYQTTPMWIKGTVVRFDYVNPHTTITLEDRSEGGQVRRWAVEGPGQAQLARMGIGTDFLRIGSVIQFCAFPYKPAEELSRMYPGVDFSSGRTSSPEYAAGHVMVMADGEKRFWEPHGLISECIRSSTDPRQSWLDFINSSADARQGWCEQRAYATVQASSSLRELVGEINDRINSPCK